MNRKRILFGGLLLLACGCNSTGGLSNTGSGALVGGGLGAGLGALIGGASGHAGRGALIGGGVGAGLGALAGNSADKAEKRDEQRMQALQAARPTPMTMIDVINMAHRHVEDAIIITQIRNTGSNFRLTADDLSTLRAEGVSEVVVLEMQRPHQLVYQQGPVVVQPAPVIIQEPAPTVGVIYRPGGYYYRRY